MVVSASLTVSDVDSRSTASYSITSEKNGDFGSISLNQLTGDWVYTLTDNLVTLLNQDAITQDVFVVQVIDDQAAIDIATISITITGLNDNPELIGTVNGALSEDNDIVSASVTFSDVDMFVTVSYLVSSNINGLFGHISMNVFSGLWVYTLTDNIVTVLDEGAVTTDEFVVIVTDDQGGEGVGRIVVTINGENDAPVFGDLVVGEADEEDELITGNVVSSDVDRSSVLSYYVISDSVNGDYGKFSLATSGNWSYVITHNLVDGLDEGDVVTDSFSVQVMDEFGTTDNGIVLLKISGENDNPIIESGLTVNMLEDDIGVSSSIIISDDDLDTVLEFYFLSNGDVTNNLSSYYGYVSLNYFSGYWEFYADATVDTIAQGEEEVVTFTCLFLMGLISLQIILKLLLKVKMIFLN